MLGFDPSIGKIPWRRAWHPTPVFLPGEFQGWRRLVGYSPQSHKELDMTEVTEHARTCVCGAESPPCSPESTTILLISYTTIQKRKFKIWKKKRRESEHTITENHHSPTVCGSRDKKEQWNYKAARKQFDVIKFLHINN